MLTVGGKERKHTVFMIHRAGQLMQIHIQHSELKTYKAGLLMRMKLQTVYRPNQFDQNVLMTQRARQLVIPDTTKCVYDQQSKSVHEDTDTS